MLYINKITNDAFQQLVLTGIPTIRINMNLRYLPRMQLWNMDVGYNDQQVNGIIITSMPNLLQAFQNVFPFGISCLTTNGLDPYNINDFADQVANLYLLDAADVAALNAELYT